MKKSTTRAVSMAAMLALGMGALAACSSDNNDSSGGSTDGGSKGGKVALLLPESKTARYEALDKPLFTAKLKELSPDTETLYYNADQDKDKQLQQAETALTQGADVLVLDPVDGAAAASIVNEANQKNVPVISYDRLITGGKLAYYVTFDNEQVGVEQGKALVAALQKSDPDKKGGIIMINGSPTDNNATLFKKGAHSVLDSSGYKILAEYDTPDWSPDKAQAFMESQVTKFSGKFTGVYAANDGTAGGAVAAMQAANVSPWPAVTGQDAELPGIQRIVAGQQYMTIYKSVKQEAENAAQAAVDLLNDKQPTGTSPDTDGVITSLLPVQTVTVDNIKDTVVKDGVYTVDQICTADYAAACTKAGLK
ncbi:sugar ABC transporter substrate-binding protein [Luteimicrobium subarcticum]|uniref:D-xylose transport system substrate-binding protein n=1 Tax=Luteimicrobium subarcticum TaxID=620910 RepID=A0A2M8WV30_9MICO|nr:sugar ABC transporter substrate-binding protein [Luteimicrobium subarcticum]PJI94783.1 D-xylose transport system substrate-binding protein [Luteimicrobium subarcticum]